MAYVRLPVTGTFISVSGTTILGLLVPLSVLGSFLWSSGSDDLVLVDATVTLEIRAYYFGGFWWANEGFVDLGKTFLDLGGDDEGMQYQMAATNMNE